MRKRRNFTEGAIYHVTSRTNNKTRVFENGLGMKIMLTALQAAKNKFRFRLVNFCIMPTHIHLLIEPASGTNLSIIMQWIKTRTAKHWNLTNGSKDHVWGNRYFARAIKNQQDFELIMNYIDQNPVTAGLSVTPEEWKASGAYHKAQNIRNILDRFL